MKGLLYKEFRLSMGELIVFGAVQLILSVLEIVLATGADTPKEISDLMLLCIACACAALYCCSLISATSFGRDATHAWQNFAAASPTGPAGQVGGKYIFMLIIYIAIFLINAAVCGICRLITGESMMTAVFLSLVFMCFMIILTALELPFFVLFGGQKGDLIKGAAFGVVMYIAAVYLLFGDISIFDQPDPMGAIIAYMSGVLSVVIMMTVLVLSMPIYCLSMTLSVKLYQRGAAMLEE